MWTRDDDKATTRRRIPGTTIPGLGCVFARSVYDGLLSTIGQSELVLESLSQLLRGLSHVLGLSREHFRSHVLHRGIGPPHRVPAAEFRPWNSHALHIAQPGFHGLLSLLL
ncbi:hypothetical protein QLX08_001353 [Tetragonisca angustula]|uniref:Uncharacterized protein n=1 Tax=Tetragonisca angustula TaxID=166442 RepID=A0AAW1AFM1_9HYME